MPKRSDFAIALGVDAPSPATKRNLERPDRASKPRSVADSFYFQLEAFLDNWRREGVAEDDVRTALERAAQTSLAMERVGKRLKGR